MRTFRVEFLGCKVNAYEAQALREGLVALGLEEAGESGGADLHVLNTCAVTGHAGATSRNRIRRARRAQDDCRVVVTGCYANEERDRLAAMDGVERVFLTDEKEGILPFVAGDLLGQEAPEAAPLAVTQMTGMTRAFVKIEDGCDDRCTFCIIPTLRGPARSRPEDAIVHEVGELVRAGHSEVVLTGVHIGYYGKEEGVRGQALMRLLRRLVGVPALARLKLSSIEVHELFDELIALWAAEPVLAPHFHLPLQSGSASVLKRMRRKYNPRIFTERVQALRTALPDVAISTDVIVGFPGETEAEFEETMQLCREAEFMKIHVFPFSPRAGTPAATMPDQVPAAVLEERKQRLLALDAELGGVFREASVGQEVPVLIEGRREAQGRLTGITDRYLRVHLEGPDAWQGQIVPVRVVAVEGEAVVGEALETADLS